MWVFYCINENPLVSCCCIAHSMTWCTLRSREIDRYPVLPCTLRVQKQDKPWWDLLFFVVLVALVLPVSGLLAIVTGEIVSLLLRRSGVSLSFLSFMLIVMLTYVFFLSILYEWLNRIFYPQTKNKRPREAKPPT